MPERYQTVYRFPSKLFYEGCPVLIEAGAIQKDTKTGKILAQVKLQNISSKTIIACKVRLKAYSVSNDLLDGVDSFPYLDLQVNKGATFGSKTPIYLPNPETRIITVVVTQVVFSDNETWSNDKDVEWSTVPNIESIKLHIKDNEIVNQYKIEVGDKADFYPQLTQGLFLCTCGNINLGTEGRCNLCNRTYSDLIRALDVDSLKIKADERIKREKEIQEENERIAKKKEEEQVLAAKRAEEERKTHIKKIKKTTIVLFPIIVVLIVLVFVFLKVINPKLKYDRAMELINSGDYEAAYALLDELGNQDAIDANKYDRAMALIDSGDYGEAYGLLFTLGRQDEINTNKYDRAMVMLDAGDYEAAYDLLEEIGNEEAIAASKYDRAIGLIESGNCEEAYQLLNGLNYQDSNAVLNDMLHSVSWMQVCPVGDTLFFGNYEQRDIEWIVLAREEGRILILSKYVVEYLPFNYTYTSTPAWSSSSIRAWLNDDFISSAFSSEERNMIQNVVLNTEGDTNTNDKVFLLSLSEYNSYSGVDGVPLALNPYTSDPTEYILRNAELRSGAFGTDLSVVWQVYDGFSSYEAIDRNLGIRPAIWISFQ